MADHLLDLLGQLLRPGGEVLAQLGEAIDIDADAVPLHLGEHLHQRRLEVVGQREEAVAVEPFVQHRPQPQRHVGVLGGVLGDLGDGDLVHPLLVLARADQLGDLDRCVAEVTVRQHVEVVRPFARVQQVTGDHRVERQPPQRDAGAAEDDQVVLEVLADFLDRLVSKDRPQRRDHVRQRQHPVARRRADGDIGRLALGPGEREAHQLGLTRVDASGLGVERDHLASGERRGQLRQRLGRVDGPVLGVPIARRRLGRAAREGRKPLGETAEAELGAQLAQPRRVKVADQGLLPVDLDGDKLVEPHQLARHQGQLAALAQVLLPLGALHPVGVGEHPVERAELVEQLLGDLRPDQRHPGDVVDLVPHQRLEVDHLVGPDAPVGHQRDLVVEVVLADVVNGDVIRDQLPRVLVPRHQPAVDARLVAQPRDGRQHVVGLKPRHGEDRNPQGLDHLHDLGHLRPQLARHLASFPLVDRVQVVAERVAGGVERTNQGVGPLILD